MDRDERERMWDFTFSRGGDEMPKPDPETMARDAVDRALRMMAEQGLECSDEHEAELLRIYRLRYGADSNSADFQAAAQNFTVSTTSGGQWEITKAPTIPHPKQKTASDSEMLDHILTSALSHSDRLEFLENLLVDVEQCGLETHAQVDALPKWDAWTELARELSEIKRRVPAYKTREQLEEARAMREYGLAIITRLCIATVVALAMIVAAGVWG